MKSKFVSRCLLCCKSIGIGDEIVKHPNVPSKWVHSGCTSKREAVASVKKLAAAAPSMEWLNDD